MRSTPDQLIKHLITPNLRYMFTMHLKQAQVQQNGNMQLRYQHGSISGSEYVSFKYLTHGTDLVMVEEVKWSEDGGQSQSFGGSNHQAGKSFQRMWVMSQIHNLPNHVRVTLFAKIIPDLHVLTNCSLDFVKSVLGLVACLEQLDHKFMTETSLETQEQTVFKVKQLRQPNFLADADSAVHTLVNSDDEQSDQQEEEYVESY